MDCWYIFTSYFFLPFNRCFSLINYLKILNSFFYFFYIYFFILFIFMVLSSMLTKSFFLSYPKIFFISLKHIIIKFNKKNVTLKICIFVRNYICKYNMIIYHLIVQIQWYFLCHIYLSCFKIDTYICIIWYVLTNKY